MPSRKAETRVSLLIAALLTISALSGCASGPDKLPHATPTAEPANAASLIPPTASPRSYVDLDQYRYVWGDEFDGDKLDPAKWTLRADMSGYEDLYIANGDLPDVMRVSDGMLHLNSIRYTDPDNPAIKYATTYSVTTYDKMNYQYGFLEIRAKVPYLQAAWPSFWMKSDGAFAPNSGLDYMTEVDVFEAFSSADTAVPNLHKWYDNSYHTQTGANNSYIFKDTKNLANEFHIYGFEWTPDVMSMYIDGYLYNTFDLSVNYDGLGSMEKDDTFLYVIFNNHIYTEKGTPSDDSKTFANDATPFPLSYDIDWIHLYQAEGKGTLYTEKQP